MKPTTARRWRTAYLVILGYLFTVGLLLPFADPYQGSFLAHVVFVAALGLPFWIFGLLAGAALITAIVWLYSWFEQDRRSKETSTLAVVGASLAAVGVFLVWAGYVAFRRWQGGV